MSIPHDSPEGVPGLRKSDPPETLSPSGVGQGNIPHSPPPFDHTVTAGSGSSPISRIARHVPEIDGYQIVGVLGQGGMGIVYRAVQVKLNRTVALKVLPAMVVTANPAAVSRFRREATSAARLHHTHIIPIYDFGEARDGYYYAMERIAGEPLSALIRQFAAQDAVSASPARLAQMIESAVRGITGVATDVEPSPAPSSSSDAMSSSTFSMRRKAYFQLAAKWMADCADALHYAHGQGIIHRDIKPSNLILSVDGRIMVADFGLAKSVGEESYTMTGSFVGTLRYVSPEQAMSKRVRVDHRTDVYSLGATMYELLCFQAAFPGDDEKAVFGAIIAKDPTPPRKINASVPPELETICLKCMEKLPDARYSTARELAEDLRRFINDLPIAAKRPGPIRRVRKFVSRHKMGVIATVSVLLVLVAVPVTIQYSRRARLADALARSADAMQLARAFENESDWDKAAKAYEAALAHYPNNAEALGNFARMRKEQYNATPDADPSLLEVGLVHCDRAIAIEPNNTGLWNTQGVLLKKLNRLPEAVRAYEKALQLNPNHSATCENLGVVQVLAGDLATGEKNIRRAAEFSGTTGSDCEFPWRNLASIELFRRSTKAAESLEKATVCNRVDSATWRLKARMYLELEGAVDAARALEDARYAERNATAPDPMLKRIAALALLRLGRYDEAIQEARAALKGGDMATINQLALAIAEAKTGRKEVAQSHLMDARSSRPAELQIAGSFVPSAPSGVLWFESAVELDKLEAEAEAAIAAALPAP